MEQIQFLLNFKIGGGTTLIKLDLRDKVAIVTGGGSGLGKAISLKLAEAGAHVIIGDIVEDSALKVVEEIKKLGVSAKFYKTNVSKEADVNHLVDETVAEFGQLDIMVNNAGINSTNMIMFTTIEEFERLIDVNLKGNYFGCKAALRHMSVNNEGKIVNVSSMAAKEGFPFTALYSATKFAIVGMTQSIAREAGAMNINVNSVCPGIIRTDMWEKMLDQGSAALNTPREDIWEQYTKDIPLGRPQTPEDIANTVVFLCSDLAENITGQSININGGQVCH
jgi:meso-butanediol dehydrogenase/(S,S)-butanediol dehydrogenase/diacetyl reductase